jgi:16S rRNA (guanine527-N7)-methyltransferase
VEDIFQREQIKFAIFAEFLKERNEVMNLTAVAEADTWRRHFQDSLELLSIAEFSGKRVIDIGSGAGFPGIPLKIACPEMSRTLLDAKEKRVEFMRESAERIGIDASAIHGRAEELGHDAQHREQYDIAVSRAVAKLNVLLELCLPFVKPGGVLVAHKGNETAQELADAANALELLCGSVERVAPYRQGSILVIRKLSPLPEQYPRKWKKIESKGL